MAEKSPDFRISPAAYLMWERVGRMGGELSSVIDRIMSLPRSQVHVARVVPFRDLRVVATVLDGWLVRVYVGVDGRGRWRRVREIQVRPSEV